MSISQVDASAAPDNARRNMLMVAGVIGALLLGGLIYGLFRLSDSGAPAQRLEGAIRPGTPEFEGFRDRLVVDTPEATESPRALGDIIMVLTTTVRNFTGRTITGLEVRAAVVDMEDKPIAERIVTVIPTRQAELEPNKTIQVPIKLEGIKKDAVRKDIRMEIAGVKFQ